MLESVLKPLGTIRSFWENLPLKNKQLLALFLILLAGVFVYANSLTGEFIWDDEYLIIRNAFIKDGSRFHELFTSDPGASAGKEYGYYRPLFILSYALDYAVWGLHPTGYHIFNLFLHLAVTFLLFFLIRSLFTDWFLAWLVSIFYVVHPVHVEVVSCLAGRVDSLVTFWFLAAFFCYVKLSKGGRNPFVFALMLLSFACALFTKENSLILPAILLLYHWTFRVKLSWGAFLSLLGVLAGYFVFRGAAFESIGVGAKLIPGLANRIPGFFAAVLNYARLLVFPRDLHMEYGLPLFPWADAQVLGGLALTTGLIAIAFWQREKRPLVFFAIAWFFIALMPVSNLYPLGFFMTERYLYLPSVGFFLLLAKGIEAGVKNKKARIWVILLASALLIFFSASVVAQNAYWQTPLAFYTRNLQFAPKSVRMNNELGRLYDRFGQKEKAIEIYRNVIRLDPKYPYAYNNIGVILLDAEKPEEAISWFQKALAQWEAYPDAWNNLGNAYLRLGRAEESIDVYKKATALLPNFGGYYNNLGNAYKAQGDHKKAIEAYDRGIQLDPWDAVTHYNLGVAYLEQKKFEEAKRSLKYAIHLRSDLPQAYFQLALVHYFQGDKEQARRSARQAGERGFSIPPQFLEELR